MSKPDKEPKVHEVKVADPATKTFDGHKADVYVNTGQVGKTFLVSATRADGQPILIAVHL